MTESDCPNCGHTRARCLFTGYSFDDSSQPHGVNKCNDCGIVFSSPLMTLNELARYYNSSYYGGDVDESSKLAKFQPCVESAVRAAAAVRARLAIRELRKARIASATSQDLLDRPLDVLDVGCGRGLFLTALAEAGHRGVGTEIGSFPSVGLTRDEPFERLYGTLEELRLPDASFDGIWIWHVLEHTLTPSATLREVSRITRDNGVVSIAVPNFGSWQSRLFGRHWFHLDLPRHRFHFTRDILEKLLQQHDLQPVRVATCSWEQDVFGWLQSFLNCIFFRSHPNGLFAFLKRKRPTGARYSLRYWLLVTLWIVIAGLAFPLAIFATLLSSLFAQGATLMITAHRLPRK